VINEIKLNVSEKMEKFGKEKRMIKVICLGLMIGFDAFDFRYQGSSAV
jgi:hypothetical protein